MRPSEYIAKYIKPYTGIQDIYTEHRGYIVWRRGTGDNVELLHIRTFEKGEGYGRQLFYKMLDRLVDDPPYHSIFGFTRVGNQEARLFYGALGFWLQPVTGLYRDGSAIFFCQSYNILLERKREYAASPKKGN